MRRMFQLHYLLIFLLKFSSVFVIGVSQSQHNTPVCKSIEIRSLEDFKLLRNCSIVVGHIHITNVQLSAVASDYNITSSVREITDYLMVYRVHGLQTLESIFPQLTLIRGQQLLFDQYSLVVHENRDIQNLGLISLLRIQKGDIRIAANPSLCFVHTVNWVHLLDNSTQQHFWLKDNKASQHCPKCKEANDISFTEAAALDLHCWSLDRNQRTQYLDNTDNYGPQCLTNWRLGTCDLCANLIQLGMCVDTCGISFFQLNKRECISQSECHKNGLVPHAGLCLEECPPSYKKTQDSKGLASCELYCTGNFVIKYKKDLAKLEDCISIHGTLTIELAEPRAKIIHELDGAMANLKEITGYLKIVRCPHLVTLNFLRNLDTIAGEELIDNKYALYVVDNHHLEDIWAPNQKVAILKGLLYFHLNPRLCYEKILQLRSSVRQSSTISIENVSPNSNGERIVCGSSVRTLNATVEDFNSTAVRIKVDPMSFDDKLVLIGYLHYYKEAPIKNVTMYDGRHGCGHDNWHMDISPNKNVRHIISNLKPATQYAYFVKTMTMTEYHLQLDAYSHIDYFQTLPSKPGRVSKIYYHSLSASQLKVHWWPPRYPNGRIIKYLLFYEKVVLPLNNQSALNYNSKTKSESDCECVFVSPEQSGPVPQDENYYDKEQITYDDAIPDIIYHSRNKYKDSYSKTTTKSTLQVNNNGTENVENIKKRDTSQTKNHTQPTSKEDVERLYLNYRQELENKSLAEQDTGADKFPIVKPQAICSYANTSIQYQVENRCTNLEYFRGTEVPGYQHSYVLSDLEPEVTYRISLRACVEGLENGCGSESSILAGTVSKRMETFLKGLKSL